MAVKQSEIKFYTLGEEIFNSVSHGVGAGLSIAGCVVAVVKAALHGGAMDVVSAAIFGAMLIILYLMSTLYHAITNDTAKRVFRVLDHCTIFLLIAGTYTPYTLISLRGQNAALGWSIFGILWGLTAFGVVLNAVSLKKFKVIPMILYIAMGWCVVIVLKPLYEAIGLGGLLFLLIGGLCYTAGIFFFSSKIKYMHAIWHLFVLAGSILHYFSILLYVIP